MLCGIQVRWAGWPIKRSNNMVSKSFGSSFGTVSRWTLHYHASIQHSANSQPFQQWPWWGCWSSDDIYTVWTEIHSNWKLNILMICESPLMSSWAINTKKKLNKQKQEWNQTSNKAAHSLSSFYFEGNTIVFCIYSVCLRSCYFPFWNLF